jgi:hypothetical protein
LIHLIRKRFSTIKARNNGETNRFKFILRFKEINGNTIPLQAYGAQRVLGRLRLKDSVTSALECGRLSAIRTGLLYPQEYPVTHFKRLSRPRAHGIAGRHGKIPSDTTGDRSRDLPTSSVVP